MKVEILSIMYAKPKRLALCNTAYGTVAVQWEGKEPEIGHEYYIELEITDTLVWDEHIFLTDRNVFLVENENEFIILAGILESIDSDGYAVLRVGDSIIPFFARGTPFNIGVNIIVKTHQIAAYPVMY